MEQRQGSRGLLATFEPDTDLEPLSLRLKQAGIPHEQITLLSPIPLVEQSASESHPFWPYAVTMAAGLVGIGVGVFFAAGTAAMYPLHTGGKPIVSAPVVGIISYETMMLLAVVTTFVTMMIRIRRAHRLTVDRESRIDDGKIALSIRCIHPGQEVTVRRLLEQAGAGNIRLVSHGLPFRKEQLAAGVMALLTLLWIPVGCSQDMQEQPSYRSQESPRLHSPAGSIPRESRAVVSRQAVADGRLPDAGKELYRINCLPCHGHNGKGTGPVAGYLKELPADLQSERVRRFSEDQLYEIITNGKDMMPSFRGELSATERMTLASFVRSMGSPVASVQP
jgi:mono/diheme cytochrome c family protein